MGEKNKHYVAGHEAFSLGVPLSLGFEGWTQELGYFADGWLAAMSEWGSTVSGVQSSPRSVQEKP